MKTLNRFIIVYPVKEEKTIGGLDVYKDKDRYIYAKVFKVGTLVEHVKEGELVYFDKSAGKDITYKNKKYKVITDADVVIVDEADGMV